MTENGETKRTVRDRLKHWATTCPDKEVFVFYSNNGRRSLTCKDVYSFALKFAARLQSRGLKKGDVVCNTLTNSPERLVTDFGIMSAGCISANAQALLTDGSDLLHVINLSKCRLLVADHTLPGGAWRILEPHLGTVADQNIKSDKTPLLEMVEFVGVKEDDGFLENLKKEENRDEVEISPLDIAVYWSTSGTTGFSKLVAQTHENVLLMAGYYRDLLKLGPEHTFYSDRPLGWAGGWPYGFISLCLKEVLTDTRGTVTDQIRLTWEAIRAEKCKYAVLTIASMKTTLERKDVLEHKDHKPLDMIVATGQPFRQHCFELVGTLCQKVVSSYGLTECGYVTSWFCSKKEDFLDNLVGTPSEMLEMKIVGEDFKEVPVGHDGQVVVRGKILFQGYVNNPKATADAFMDGWMLTNDLGHRDEAGRMFVEGRRSDAIMHGEYIIYPSWVERKLRTCPYISEVMVVGIPDEMVHHKICACVIPKSGQSVTVDMLKEYCDPMFTTDLLQEMSSKPEYYIVVDKFPLRPTGKPDRRTLAEQAAKIITSQ